MSAPGPGDVVVSRNMGSRELVVTSPVRRLDGDSRGCVDVTWLDDVPSAHPAQRRGFTWTECVCNLSIVRTWAEQAEVVQNGGPLPKFPMCPTCGRFAEYAACGCAK